jgi:hypothetical protein
MPRSLPSALLSRCAFLFCAFRFSPLALVRRMKTTRSGGKKTHGQRHQEYPGVFSRHFPADAGSHRKKDSSLWPDEDGSSLQVGGMSYRYDKTLHRGERVWEILVNGQLLGAGKTYAVAMSNFMMQNQDYPAIVTAETIGTFNACDEAIRDFIKNKGVEGSLEGPRMNAQTKL